MHNTGSRLDKGGNEGEKEEKEKEGGREGIEELKDTETEMKETVFQVKMAE